MTCEKIQLLLSKYADNEATQPEREAVRVHIAGCDQCARKLADFEQVPAIFASTATRPPEPQLRVGLFREIGLIKEEERRKQRDAQEKHPWYIPAAPLRIGGRSRSGLARLWTVVNPVTVGLIAVLAFFGLVAYTNRPLSTQKPDASKVAEMLPVPTMPLPIVVANFTNNNQSGLDIGSPIPDTAGTKVIPAVFSPIAEAANSTVLPTVTVIGDGFVLLADPTPVLEDLDSSGRPVHLVRDPMYGYSIYYPSNWWTQVDNSVRYFRPWVMDSSNSSSYWMEVHVSANTQGYNAATYNSDLLDGAGTLISGVGSAGTRLRHVYFDAGNGYDDLFSFDSQHIYTLHLVVPSAQQPSTFRKRWSDAEAIFARMTARADFTRSASSTPVPASDNSALFLNGPDLYLVSMDGRARAVTNGGFNVRQFALSPDMHKVVFTSAQTRTDVWPKQLYLSNLDSDAPDASQPLWTNAIEIHDVVWYNDWVLLALAKTSEGSGLYRISLPQTSKFLPSSVNVQLITPLDDSRANARSLTVSPDRQLITFLAPLGESAGTNVYAVRPDGSDLRVLISHSVPISPSANGTPILAPENQAIKSYVWLDGRLESQGYRFNLLYTCGNSQSPSFYQGGSLYSVTNETHNPLVGSNMFSRIGVADPTKLQIVHMAYSTDGKLAMTGYYNDYQEGRADNLAGLWTAEIVNGRLVDMRPQPAPQAPDGITDLQWSPDNKSLVYRETIPQDPESLSARYDGHSPFTIIKQDLLTGNRVVLYGGVH